MNTISTVINSENVSTVEDATVQDQEEVRCSGKCKIGMCAAFFALCISAAIGMGFYFFYHHQKPVHIY